MKKLLKQLLAPRGMSMLEGIVSMGLMAAGAAAALNMDQLNLKQLGLVAGGSKVFDIIKHAHSTLQNSDACANTLATLVPGSGVQVPGIKDQVGTVFNAPGSQVDGIKIMDISLEAPDLARQTFSPAGATGLVELKFVFHNMKEEKPRDIVRRFKVWISTDAAGAVERCQTPMLLSTSLWQTTASNPRDIYYAGGEVGVGQPNPTFELEVSGRVQFATADGQKGIIGKGDTIPRIELAADRSFGIIRADGSRSDILLGDLLLGDVARLMGFPSGTLPCTPAIEGALRYNTTTNAFQFCGGDKWRSIVNVP